MLLLVYISGLYSSLMLLLHNIIHVKILAWVTQSSIVNYFRNKKNKNTWNTNNFNESKDKIRLPTDRPKELPSATEITKQLETQKYSIINNNICVISGCNPGPHTLQGTNTYLIGYNHYYNTNTDTNYDISASEGKILIDAGELSKSNEYVSILLDVIFPLTNTKYISSILLTHYHHDHLGT